MKYLKGTYKAPIDQLGRPGQWLRQKILDLSLAGTPSIVRLQSFRSPFCDVLMKILSFLGTEDFYTPVVVTLAWIIDVKLARLFCILMAIGFYTSSFLKNFLRLPRPPNPPVHVLETTHDWSTPSLHAVIGTILPGYLLFYCLEHYELTKTGKCELSCLIVVWSCSVHVSRLYLGVHSTLDIAFGIFLGVLILPTFLCVDDYILSSIIGDVHGFLFLFLVYCFLLYAHPVSEPPTKSYGETVTTSGVSFGCLLSLYYISDFDVHSSLLEKKSPLAYQYITCTFLRLLLGCPFIFLIRACMKPALQRLLLWLCGCLRCPAFSLTAQLKMIVPLNKHYNANFHLPTFKENETETYETEGLYFGNLPLNVDTPTKFATYAMMGLVAMVWLHHLFNFFRI